MEGYRIPWREAESEFTEKRSRFIGHVWHVEREEDAKQRIAETRRKYHDARHNCWCYLVREDGGEIVRYGDDGEPQGTAGQPMLNVFQRRGVSDVCCVVTRYFGGVLLGAGGLARAYGRAARDALDAAGTAALERRTLWDVPCTWPLLERVKQELAARGGELDGVEYGEQPLLHCAFPPGAAEGFAERLRELSAGALVMRRTGEAARPVRIEEEQDPAP